MCIFCEEGGGLKIATIHSYAENLLTDKKYKINLKV